MDLPGEEKAVRIGDLRVAEVGAPHSHASSILAPTGAIYLLVLQLEGTSTHRQNEREAKLDVGDFTVCASSCSNWLSCTGRGRCLVIEIPDRLMRRHVASPEDVVAIRMSGSRGITSVLSNFIRNFWSLGAPARERTVGLRLPPPID